MTARRRLISAPLALAFLFALATATAPAASPAPAWKIQAVAAPTNFVPGGAGDNRYEAFFANVGAAVTDQSPLTIVDELPPGLGVKSVGLYLTKSSLLDLGPSACESELVGASSTVTCTIDESLPGVVEPAKLLPGDQIRVVVNVSVPPTAVEGEGLTNEVGIEGGGTLPASAKSHNQVSSEEAAAGFQEFDTDLVGTDGQPVTQAASHPYQYLTSFAVNVNPTPAGSVFPFLPATGDLKDIEVALPPGLVGNPTATERCSAQDFNTLRGVTTASGGAATVNDCSDDSVVGLSATQQLEGEGIFDAGVPIFNLTPPRGMPAQFGFQILGLPIYINTRLRSDGDYGVTAYVQNTPEAKRVTAALITFWGTPADESHDRLRGSCRVKGGLCPVDTPPRPFLRLPSSCASPLETTMTFDTWAQPGALLSAITGEPAPSGCALPDFSPEIEAKPSTNVADAPSGLHFNLHLPQKENEDPEGLGEADLRDATVTLPEGLLVNPSSADGLSACSPAQIGLTTPVGQAQASFTAKSPNCPDASKVGKVQVDTPLLDHPLPGAVYLAEPFQNPFSSLIAIYVTVDDPVSGVVVKLAGHVQPDPLTGRLATTVNGSPQLPFEDFQLDFFEGARAPLRTPATCGTHTTTTSLKPWTSPAFGPNATPSDSFQITTAPAGAGSCPSTTSAQPNSPNFEAGTAAPVAGAFSPFSLRLARADGSQEIKGIDLTLPPGLTGRLAGLSYCPDGVLAGAASKSGRQEQASPSCPGTSELGTVTVAAGAGPAPYRAQGKAYLAAPYKGAPISMAAITPAVAGPFDLGTVVVRSALYVDPETARIRAVSDPIPTILQGIPLDVRSIDLRVDRPDFTLNPTSCDPMAFSGGVLSTLDQIASLSQRFQVGGCQDLAFKPRLSLRMKGGTKRADHPQFTATLKMPPGGANIAKAQVALPRSVFLDQANIRTVCTRVQFAASACPKGAVYGYAKAWTPLLDQPLQGPVYLRSSDNLLPDLVANLNGQIHVVLHGRTDSIRGGIRNTFEGVPDAPSSKFVLRLKGGKRGLLINSRNICNGKNRATAKFTAQSGKVIQFRPLLQPTCKGQRKRRKDGR